MNKTKNAKSISFMVEETYPLDVLSDQANQLCLDSTSTKRTSHSNFSGPLRVNRALEILEIFTLERVCEIPEFSTML